MDDIKQRLLVYAESKNGKGIQSITDKGLVSDLSKLFDVNFFYQSKQLTIKKMAAIVLSDMTEPVCECCGKSVSDRFPWKPSQTTQDRTTPYGSWARTCSASCNQILIEKEGKRSNTMLEKYGVKNIMQKDGFAKEAMKNRNIDWEKVGIEQQKRKLLNRGVSKVFIDSIDFSSDESKAEAIKKVAEDYRKQTGEIPDRYKLSEITGIHKTLLNRWLYNVPEYSALYRSGNSISKSQIEIKEFIQSLGFVVSVSDRTIIKPYEIDLVIPEKKLGIEYCGVWCHSEYFGNKDKKYHITKTELAEERGFNLLQIYDVEWNDLDGREIWKSIIKHKLGITETKIYARKCDIRVIDSKTSNEFLDKNHLQGSLKTTNHIGLFYFNELVSVMSYGKSRFGNETEIIRMATKRNTVIIGGVSKLMNYVKQQVDSIVCFADRRYSGLNCGYSNCLEYSGKTEPNWWGYSKKEYVLYSRHKFMKHKLKEMFGDSFDVSKSSFENMVDNGYDRIWDCGSLKFIWNKK